MNMCTYSFLIVVCPSPPHLRASSSSSWGEGVSPNSLSARHCAEHLICIISCSVQLSDSVMFNSLRPHGLQHTRLPCPSLPPRVCSDSCPSSRWCHPTVSSCRPLLLLPLVFSSIRVFSKESVLHIRWPKYWRFSISPSNEYSGLTSFRTDWLNLLAVQGTLKSLLQYYSSKASILQC